MDISGQVQATLRTTLGVPRIPEARSSFLAYLGTGNKYLVSSASVDSCETMRLYAAGIQGDVYEFPMGGTYV